MFDIWCHFERLRFLFKNFGFFAHIAESANIAENAQYRRNFLAKNFRRIYAAKLFGNFWIIASEIGLPVYQFTYFEKWKLLPQTFMTSNLTTRWWYFLYWTVVKHLFWHLFYMNDKKIVWKIWISSKRIISRVNAFWTVNAKMEIQKTIVLGTNQWPL